MSKKSRQTTDSSDRLRPLSMDLPLDDALRGAMQIPPPERESEAEEEPEGEPEAEQEEAHE